MNKPSPAPRCLLDRLAAPVPWLALVPFLAAGACGNGARVPAPAAADAAARAALPGSAALDSAFAAESGIGAMLIRRLSDGREWAHRPERVDSGFLPASTFKIVNAAIGLETGVVESPEERFAWDGVQRRFDAWNRDHTLRSGMSVSAVPVYQELARRIGEPRMAEWLRRIGYGNADTDGGIDRFWLTGELRISARQQVDFLTRFVEGEAPFSPATRAAVADMLLVERAEDAALFAKTGWAFEVQLGWWVGWTERRGERYAFALNLQMPDSRADPPRRARIGRAALVAVGALPASAANVDRVD